MIVEMVLLALARLVRTPVNGAYGWISVGPVTIQPAEYLKIIIIRYLARRFSKTARWDCGLWLQVLTQNQWLPRALTTGVLFCQFWLVAGCPDLEMIISWSWWHSSCIRLVGSPIVGSRPFTILAGSSMLVLSCHSRFVGVKSSPKFLYLVTLLKRLGTSLIPLMTWRVQDTSS